MTVQPIIFKIKLDIDYWFRQATKETEYNAFINMYIRVSTLCELLSDLDVITEDDYVLIKKDLIGLWKWKEDVNVVSSISKVT